MSLNHLTIIERFESHIQWLDQLKNMSEKQFFDPLAPGKWSVAALVSHFKSWDDYVLTRRIPLFKGELAKGDKAPSLEEVNQEAEKYAHSGISQTDLINEVIEKRTEFISILKSLPHEVWNKTHQLSKSSVLLSEYIKGLIEHDQHHQSQVSL